MGGVLKILQYALKLPQIYWDVLIRESAQYDLGLKG